MIAAYIILSRRGDVIELNRSQAASHAPVSIEDVKERLDYLLQKKSFIEDTLSKASQPYASSQLNEELSEVESAIAHIISQHPQLSHSVVFPFISEHYIWRNEEKLKPLRGVQLNIFKDIASGVCLWRDAIKVLASKCVDASEDHYPRCLDDLEKFQDHIQADVFEKNKDFFKKQSKKLKKEPSMCFQRILVVQSYIKTRSFDVRHPKPIFFWEDNIVGFPSARCLRLFDVLTSFKISDIQELVANGHEKPGFAQFGLTTVQSSKGRPRVDGRDLLYHTPLSVWYFRRLEDICNSDHDAEFNLIANSERIEQNYLELASKFRFCIEKEFDCDVNFSSMLATLSDDQDCFPCIELKRQQIGWFFLQNGNWFHFRNDCMQALERWHNSNLGKKSLVEYEHFHFVDSEGTVWAFRGDLNGLFANGKLLHRQVLSEVCGDVVFHCAMWPSLQIEHAKNDRIMRRPLLDIFQEIWKSFVLVAFPASLHRSHYCPCNPEFNLTNMIKVLLLDIGPAVRSFVEVFMMRVHSDLMAAFQKKFSAHALPMDYSKCFDVPVYSCSTCASLMTCDHPASPGVKANDISRADYGEQLSSEDEDDLFYEEPEHALSYESSDSFEACSPLCWVAHRFRSLHCGKRVAWGNSSPRKWLAEDAHLHIGKLFCSIGNFASKFSSDLDAANLMNILIFCKAFHPSCSSNCWWRSPPVPIPPAVPMQARNVRNHVMHLSCLSSGLDCKTHQNYTAYVQSLVGNIFQATLEFSEETKDFFSQMLKMRACEVIREFNEIYPKLKLWLLGLSKKYQFLVPVIKSVDIHGLSDLEPAFRELYFLLSKPSCPTLDPVMEAYLYISPVLKLLRESVLIKKYMTLDVATLQTPTWGSKTIALLDAIILNACHPS